MPKFSIIAVDYEKWTPRERMVEGLTSIANQTFKDFELLICHDGPKEVPYEEELDFESIGLNPIILNTPERENKWGHPSRRLAMQHATGEYFINFNVDNLLTPNCLENLYLAITYTKGYVLVFNILMRGNHTGNDVLRGVPPVHTNIDAMQLVASREIWESIGWWYRDEPSSDGMIIEEICQMHPWLEVPLVLGEHR